MKYPLIICLSLVLSSTAYAACPTLTVAVKDGNGASQTFCVGGTSGNFVNQITLLDSASVDMTDPVNHALRVNTINPKAATTTQTGSFVTTQNTFQTVLAANTSRLGATVQNTSASGDVEYVFFGATGSATKSASFQLQPGWFISAVLNNGIVLTDNIAITCADATPANCTFVVSAQ